MKSNVAIFLVTVLSIAIFSMATAQVVIPMDDDFYVIPLPGEAQGPQPAKIIYYNDFSSEADSRRIDQFVAYRDPFVVAHTIGLSDHSVTGGINCTAPEETRPQSRENPVAHVYQCLPGGNPDAGHQMAFAMDTSGYGFAGGLPDQVFEGLTEVAVDINTTDAGGRNFIEIKVIPANSVFVNGLPCIPDLPCNGGWDYDDINAVGAGGSGLHIATPQKPDGYDYSRYDSFQLGNGDTQYNFCDPDIYCFKAAVHVDNISIRDRYKHIFRDNGNGTLAYGVEEVDGAFHWVEAPGSFPSGPVRVVIAFHNYTGTKDNNGPGVNGNLSPSEGGFTWHWDELSITAGSSTPSLDYFGGADAERIVTPDGCIAFSQGQREVPHHTNVLPRFHCVGDSELDI